MQDTKNSAARTAAQKQSAEAAALATLAKRVPDPEETGQLLEGAVAEFFDKILLQEVVSLQLEMLEICVQSESFLALHPFRRARMVASVECFISHAIDLDYLSESIAFANVLRDYKLPFPDGAPEE